MPTRSAGLLVYRRAEAGIEVLLVHPGGPYWRRKDDGAWSIPKGEHDADEESLDVAIREFREELGVDPPSTAAAVPLGEHRQPSGKLVTAWAVEGDVDVTEVVSNTFEIEWPPRSGRTAEFPEVDRAGWFPPDEARRKLLRGQVILLDRLAALLDDPDANV
jgi:predicted NUDIX family NTP pyrophosphohydrolase